MKYMQDLKKLRLPKDEFAVFGSGPLAIRNLRKNKDLDIIVKSKLWKKLKSRYKKHSSEKGAIEINHIEIWKTWPGFKSLNRLIDDADIIKGVRFVKLQHVLQWKQKRMKEKDKKDIILIKKYLTSHKKLARKTR